VKSGGGNAVVTLGLNAIAASMTASKRLFCIQ
jgi:hypothetical protein